MLSSAEPGNHVLRVDAGADVSTGRGTFRGVYGPLQRIGFGGWVGKRVSFAKRVGPILTIYTSYDVLLRKEVPFGDRDQAAAHLRGYNPPPKKPFIFGA